MYSYKGSVLGRISRESLLKDVVGRKFRKVRGISCSEPSYPGVLAFCFCGHWGALWSSFMQVLQIWRRMQSYPVVSFTVHLDLFQF